MLKGLLRKELIDTIRAVHSDKSASRRKSRPRSPSTPLTADGNANKEIAAQLSIAEDAVEGYVKNILAKLGTRTTKPLIIKTAWPH